MDILTSLSTLRVSERWSSASASTPWPCSSSDNCSARNVAVPDCEPQLTSTDMLREPTRGRTALETTRSIAHSQHSVRSNADTCGVTVNQPSITPCYAHSFKFPRLSQCSLVSSALPLR
jgi:hypothetical protein